MAKKQTFGKVLGFGSALFLITLAAFSAKVTANRDLSSVADSRWMNTNHDIIEFEASSGRLLTEEETTSFTFEEKSGFVQITLINEEKELLELNHLEGGRMLFCLTTNSMFYRYEEPTS